MNKSINRLMLKLIISCLESDGLDNKERVIEMKREKEEG